MLPLYSVAQTVVFNVSPGGGFVRVAGEVLNLSENKTLELTPGTYEAEIWAPRFKVARKEFVVEAGRPTVVNLAMITRADDYDGFQDRVSQYNTAKLKRSLADGAVVGITTGLAYVTLTGRRDDLNDLEDLIENRRITFISAVTPSQIEGVATEYNNAVASYEDIQNSHNTLVVTTGILAAVGTLFAVKYFTSKSRFKEKRPVYAAENPFVGTAPRLKSSLHLGTSSSLLGLTLKF